MSDGKIEQFVAEHAAHGHDVMLSVDKERSTCHAALLLFEVAIG
mgnify:CR=1 FL=1